MIMNVIRAIVHDGRIDVPAPSNLPDGSEVLVELSPIQEKLGLDESEWRDDPEAIAEWIAWLATLEPIDFAEPGGFDEEFKRFNIEAVRKQMYGEHP